MTSFQVALTLAANQPAPARKAGSKQPGSCSAVNKKETYQLSETEQQALDTLLAGIYKENLPLRARDPYIKVTTSELPLGPDKAKRLENPITTVGAITDETTEGNDAKAEGIKRDLDKALARKAATWNENGKARSVRVIAWAIVVDTTHPMGAIGEYFHHDVVIIYPLKVAVDCR